MGDDKPADVICEGDVCRRVTPEEAAAHRAQQHQTGADLALILGDTLLGQDGKEVPLSAVTGPGKVLALYFSAHWCPPCRGFTPLMAKIYTKFKQSHAQKDNFEVIFVSSDRSEEAFNDYFKEMPWLAVPFGRRDLKAKLGHKYKVNGIPSLIILDGETGDVITANGRDAISDDQECANFPWRPKPLNQVFAGPLVDKSGKELAAEEALAGKVTLVYFSAHWCPPCRAFTPELVAMYNKLKEQGKSVEVVFVSGDRNEKQFQEYLEGMPWLAVPYSDQSRINELNRVFEVQGIPTLIVLDEAFKVITTKGRGAVASDPQAANFPWRRKPVDKLSALTVEAINDEAIVLLVLGGDTSDEAAAAARAEAVLSGAATSPAGQGVTFLWGVHGNDLVGRVMDFLKQEPLNPDAPEDMLMFVDIPSQVSYPTHLRGPAITAAAVQGMMAQHKAGILQANPLCEDDD